MDDKQWFLAAGGKSVGPMTAERVRERIATGKITPKTKAFREGMAGWLLLKEVPEFAEAAAAAPASGGTPAGGTSAVIAPEEPDAPAESAAPPAPPAEASAAPAKSAGEKAASEAPALDKAAADKPAAPGATPGKPGIKPGSGPKPALRGAKTLPARKALAAPAAKAAAAGAAVSAGAAASTAPEGPAAPPGPGIGARLSGLLGSGPLPVRFEAPHRIERKDVWLAFRIGFDRPRVYVALLTSGAAFFVALVLAIMGGVASFVWAPLGIPFALISLLAVPSVILLGTGALAYQTRRRLAEGETPGVKDALGFAKSNAFALSAVPFGVTFAVLLPVLLLVFLSLFIRIPYAGPVVTGLIYCIHLLLGALTLFLGVAAGLSWTLSPIIVGFEETGPRETVRVLFDYVKRSAVRFVAWSFFPSLGLLGLTVALVLVGFLIVAIPLTINTAVGGGLGGIGDILSLFGGGGGRRGGFSLDDYDRPSRGSFDTGFRSGGGSGEPAAEPRRTARAPEPRAPEPRAPEPAPSAAPVDADGVPEVEIVDVMTDPASYEGKTVRSKVWWRSWSEDGARVTALGAVNEVALSIHELAIPLHGKFLDGMGMTQATVVYEVHEKGDGLGVLIAVQPDGARAPRRIHPTEAQIAADAEKKAKEKAESEARDKARKEKAAAVTAAVEAAIAAKDTAKLEQIKKSKDWSALEHREETELSNKIYHAVRGAAGEKLVAEVKALLAADDFLGASAKVKFPSDKIPEEYHTEARKLVKARDEELDAEAKKDPVRTVKLDDGTEVKLELGDLTTYLIVKSVTFSGREAASGNVKKPFALTLEYRWTHTTYDQMTVDGSSALVTKKAPIGKDGKSVKLVFDQAAMPSGKASLRARDR